MLTPDWKYLDWSPHLATATSLTSNAAAMGLQMKMAAIECETTHAKIRLMVAKTAMRIPWPTKTRRYKQHTDSLVRPMLKIKRNWMTRTS